MSNNQFGDRFITIWGRENSSNVRKVLWLCEELDIDFERIDIGGHFGGLESPEYQNKNPNRVIPTIRHEDYILWESNVILRYLTSIFDHGDLWPQNPRARAEADRWMDWQVTTLRPPMVPLVLDWIYERPMDTQACEKMHRIWKVMDNHLETNRFLGGDNFTIGDIPCAMITDWWRCFPIKHPNFPNLQRWYSEISQRPGFKKYVLNKPYGPAEDH
jgi:glutathione S-transferase